MVTKDRSPKSPRNPLKSAIEATQKLFGEARRAPVSREAAAKVMGYSGLTGVSSTLLGSMAGYGLTQKKGPNIAVSDLAIAILHPRSPEQRSESLRAAALAHPLFASLAETHLDCAPSVITSELIHQGFSPEAAAKTAKVFLANAEFAGLTGHSYSATDANDVEDDDSDQEDPPSDPRPPITREMVPASPPIQASPRGNVLATYKIPLGANEAELVFTGESLEPEDFDALIDYVEIFKKQYERKRKMDAPPASNSAVPASFGEWDDDK